MTQVVTTAAHGGGVLFDIGAHIGYYSCLWIAAGGRLAEAYEPSPHNQQTLLRNIGGNGLEGRIRVHDVALGYTEGERTLICTGADLGRASMAHLQGAGVHTLSHRGVYHAWQQVLVRVQRLDHAVREQGLPHPSLVKIDVEGAEAEVVLGAENLLRTARPMIVCEVHNADAGLVLGDLLQKWGFSLTIQGHNNALAVAVWRSASP
jgi:FkbM family methyltransferase